MIKELSNHLFKTTAPPITTTTTFKMLLTMVARVVDGLPLSASMPSDEQTSREIQEYQTQAKMLFRKLTELSPSKCSIESGNYVFHYSINEGVCYLVLVERSFPKRHAFAYLEDIQTCLLYTSPSPRDS